jgi:hypothetical protein
MKKLLNTTAALASILTWQTLIAATYYSQGDLDPITTGSWNTMRAGGGTNPAGFLSGDLFIIQNTHDMVTSGPWLVSGAGSKLWIEDGGSLTATFAITLSTATVFQIDNGGKYIHDNATPFGSSIFQGAETFATASTIELRNSNATGPSNITFGNLLINLVHAAANVNLNGAISTINGSLSVQSTNGFELRLSSNTAYTLVIGGDLGISGGTLNTSNGSTAGRTYSINLGGHYQQSGGSFTHTNSASGCQLNMNFTGADKSFTRGAGAVSNANINWNINAGASVLLNNDLPVAVSRTLTVNGQLNTGTRSVTGAGGFSLASTGTLRLAHSSGINGAISVTGTKNYPAGADYVFDASTITAFPSTVQQASFGDPGDVTLNAGVTLNRDVRLTGVLGLGDKILNNTGSTLTIAGTISRTTGTIAGTGATSFEGPAFIPGGLFDGNVVNGDLLINRAAGVALNSNLSVTGSLTMISGNLLIGSNTLTLNGEINNNGGALDGTLYSNLVLGGSSGQLVNFATNASLNDLTLNKPGGTATLGTTVNTYGVVAWTDVGGTLALGNSNLVLKSVATSTARIAAVPSGKLTGGTSVTVERYILAKRAWRLLSTPVGSTGSVWNNWQNGGTYVAGAGVLITGPGASPATNGLDPSPQNTVTLYRYDQAGNSWAAVTNTRTTNLSDHSAYLLFIRGDRNPNNLSIGNWNSTTLRSTGTIRTGDQQYFTNATAEGFTLIGNPYASPIDFNAVFTDISNGGSPGNTNILRKFWIWDPTIGERGAYVTVSHNGSGYDVVPISAQTNHIQSGQAFFVQSDDEGTPQLTIRESHKSNNTIQTVFRTNTQKHKVVMQLRRNIPGGGILLVDGAQANFDTRFSDAVDKHDALKMFGFDESLSLKRNGKLLSIEARPIHTKDTLFIHTGNLKTGTYELKIETDLNAAVDSVFIEDDFLNTKTLLNTSLAGYVPFDVTTDPRSRAIDRFRLILQPAPPLATPHAHLNIFPNPTSHGSFRLHAFGLEPGDYTIRIYDSFGRNVHEKRIAINGVNTGVIAPGVQLTTGIYRVFLANKLVRLWSTLIVAH